MKTNYALLIGLVIVFTMVTACIAQETTSSPLIPVQIQKVTVAQILEDPLAFENVPVELTGKITSQCGSGCWFIMSDDTGDLYVNIRPNNFVIPPATGKEVTTQGNITVKDNDVALIGSSVLLDGKTYP
ncbi:MAG TPA: hypothetical protein VN372_09880 [Methanospirillum sp.]|nr:hypothetical protein [Methanospirillum sp.]